MAVEVPEGTQLDATVLIAAQGKKSGEIITGLLEDNAILDSLYRSELQKNADLQSRVNDLEALVQQIAAVNESSGEVKESEVVIEHDHSEADAAAGSASPTRPLSSPSLPDKSSRRKDS